MIGEAIAVLSACGSMLFLGARSIQRLTEASLALEKTQKHIEHLIEQDERIYRQLQHHEVFLIRKFRDFTPYRYGDDS